ncbi:phosphomethylpyrimidine synthase ThiC [Myxococcus sp. MxC21-1]|uniref:phosphomethylpyrimidine synthase ThiC n=1 Tax=Myxococcus sp. MxC21-1 TaxID=3041439 RepID=UPI0029306353|nr:phosphomethylpyrimidine synthase ThiC [Myxococcus sp. MxC21-1]WNZ60942.1 phosphomethylpyrimidine synthase ThiC [Myxococcus sp. MxC21-1]
MALIGTSTPGGHAGQLKKLEALLGLGQPPDLISDLSIVPAAKPLWAHVLESGHRAATLPVYSVRRRGRRIAPEELLATAMQQMEAGVGLLTIHPTASRPLIESAQARRVPWTSRGGGLVIDDMLESGRDENVYLRILPDLVHAAARHGTVLSLGATFRSANIFDALDGTQLAEIDAQLALAKRIMDSGVGVVIESPGHARPADIHRVGVMLAASGYPVMPLGPIPTDAAAGFDHVAAAIGATLLGMEGAAHILAAVTREEHTGSVPSISSTLEAVRAAQVAAHIIDLHRLGATELDEQVSAHRAEHHTCVDGKTTHGCSRCGVTCPLVPRSVAAAPEDLARRLGGEGR